jgi:hypothetical protein
VDGVTSFILAANAAHAETKSESKTPLTSSTQ